MHFNEHWELKGKHAFLSPSNYHWLNYSSEKLASRWQAAQAVELGIKLHKFAEDAINLGVFLKGNSSTLARYVNDAIYYKLTPEVILYYSQNCFGTADAIRFDSSKGVLRIHDLKTGSVPASFVQLEIYAALFCLEYGVDPARIQIALRIYQGDDVVEETPDASLIQSIMDNIVTKDSELNELRG